MPGMLSRQPKKTKSGETPFDIVVEFSTTFMFGATNLFCIYRTLIILINSIFYSYRQLPMIKISLA